MYSLPLKILFLLKVALLGLIWLFGGQGAAVALPPGVQARLHAQGSDGMDLFGAVLALSRDGRVLVVGAELDASRSASDSGDKSLPGAGAVRVFEREGDHWIETAYLKAPMPTAGGAFGFSLALSDDANTLAVGSPFEPGEGLGSVYVFGRADKGWAATGQLRAPRGVSHFGIALDIDNMGQGVAVAALDPDDQAQAHVFAQCAGRWEAMGVATLAKTPAAHGLPRLALAGQGHRLALARSHGSLVQVFEPGAGGWIGSATLTRALEPGVQALDFAANGRTLAVAGEREAIELWVEAAPTKWQAQAQLRVDADAARWRGLALSADGRLLVAHAADSGAYVYRFQQHGDDWRSLPPLAVAGGFERGGDPALALSLSADGQWLAVGARLETGDPRRLWARPWRSVKPVGVVHLYAPA